MWCIKVIYHFYRRKGRPSDTADDNVHFANPGYGVAGEASGNTGRQNLPADGEVHLNLPASQKRPSRWVPACQ